MDWRSRRYYTVTFAWETDEMRREMIKRIDGIKSRTYRYVRGELEKKPFHACSIKYDHYNCGE